MNLQKEKWEKMQRGGYFYTQEKINEIVRKTLDRDICVFDDFERFFRRKFPLEGRVVLEIGFGGGWWLATPIKRGAYGVGFEVSREIIKRAEIAFQQAKLKDCKFYEVDERYFSILQPSSIDYIFEITVFQHIDPEVTKRYIETAYEALKSDGVAILQFLMNDKNPYKNPFEGEGAVFYSASEVDEMITTSNFIVERVYRSWEEGESHWNHYLLRKPRSRPDRLRLETRKRLCKIRRLFLQKKEKIAKPIIADTYPKVHRNLFHGNQRLS